MIQIQHKKTYSIVLLFFSTVIWGSTFIVIKDSLGGVNAVAMVAYRCSLSAVLLAVGLVLSKRYRIFANFRAGLILGLAMTAIYLPQTSGLCYTTPFNSGFITGLFVIFTPIFHFIFWREKTNSLSFGAIVLAIAGLWFVTGGVNNLNIGDILTLVAAMAFSFQIIFASKFVQSGMNPVILTFQQFFVTALISLVVMLLWHLPWQVTSIGSYYGIVYLAIFASGLCYIAQFVAQKHMTALAAAIILTLEPVFSAVFAWTLGNEPFVWIKAFGGLLIIMAMFLECTFLYDKTNTNRSQQ